MNQKHAFRSCLVTQVILCDTTDASSDFVKESTDSHEFGRKLARVLQANSVFPTQSADPGTQARQTPALGTETLTVGVIRAVPSG